MLSFIIHNLSEVPKVAEEFLKSQGSNRKFAFYGDMGAGKTTFITELCRQLDAIDLVSSPTFALINQYETAGGKEIYHFDFYRIHSAEELYDIGFEEYCNSDAYCFIEWPEKAEEVLPPETVKIKISELGDQSRKLEIRQE